MYIYIGHDSDKPYLSLSLSNEPDGACALHLAALNGKLSHIRAYIYIYIHTCIYM